MARLWPGGPTAFDLHQHVSLLSLAFAVFHALILLGDRYIDYTLATVLVPFASRDYRPIGVGLGQLAFYPLAVVGLSFYVRPHRPPRLARAALPLLGVFGWRSATACSAARTAARRGRGRSIGRAEAACCT
ncbi:MAG: hypothetical protein U0470_10465 [Anaerolineae bacterium]